MEVSSEQGHPTGDEDIDIDFDLGAGDEDHILDDAISNTGFDDELQAQPSPAPGNDETMFDEEPYHTNEENLTQELEADGMDHETLTMSFDAPESADVEFGDDHTVITTSAADIPHSETQLMEGAPVSTEKDVQREALDAVGDSTIEAPLHSLVDESEAQNAESSHHTSSASSPNNGEAATTDDVTSPISVPKPSKGPATANESALNEAISVIAEDDKKADNLHKGDEPAPLPLCHEVIVAYQDAEYALFAASDSDDLDSFFLSDRSILGKPLTNLFEAIRAVIVDDLADDDELCVMVEDLGLEIMEVSCICPSFQRMKLTPNLQNYVRGQDITFGQIIELHAKLLRNNGAEAGRPLHMYLGTRPSFRVRFAKLTKDAEEGKGLSEIVQWDGHSESAGETEGLPEYHEGEESLLEEDRQEQAEEHLDDLPRGLDDHSAELLPGSDVNDTVESKPAERAASDFNAVNAQQTNTDDQPVGGVEVPDNGADTKNDNSEYDEDGDLLDYSDEEDAENSSEFRTNNSRARNGTYTSFISPCFKPDTCFCSKCNDLLLAEYQAKNEELRRSSISHATEDDATSQQIEASGAVDGADKQLEEDLNAEDGVDYYDEEPEKESPVLQETKEGKPPTDSGVVHQPESQHEEHNNGPDLEDGIDSFQDGNLGLENGGHFPETLETLLTDDQQTLEDENGPFDDIIEFGEEDFTVVEPLPVETSESHSDTLQLDLPSEYTEGNAPEATGPAEAEDMESIGSDKTLEAQTVSGIGQGDEIDYDDDETRETSEAKLSSSAVKAPAASHISLNKRPRLDDSSDEAIGTRSNGVWCRHLDHEVIR